MEQRLFYYYLPQRTIGLLDFISLNNKKRTANAVPFPYPHGLSLS